MFIFAYWTKDDVYKKNFTEIINDSSDFIFPPFKTNIDVSHLNRNRLNMNRAAVIRTTGVLSLWGNSS